jgi:mitochondrial splicing suppressor protein 51
LHVKPGTPETEEAGSDKPQVRLFILGARAESSLPPHVWEQLCMLFPSALLHLHFIGPQVSLPKPAEEMKKPTKSSTSTLKTSTLEQETIPPTSTSPRSTSNLEPSSSIPTSPATAEEKSYVPNVYEPPTPAPIARLKRTREEIEVYGVPSYTVPYTHQLTITGMQANYMEVHHLFRDTFDPYTDAFVLFSPGFGFPSPTSVNENGNPVLQIVSPTEWGPVIPELLATKCPIFVTGFSPADVERDVRSLSNAPGVAGEFDWIITPGENEFGSIKWEVADFDPRVMVKTNWGVWGIRGKTREIREKSWFGL